jgi:hypothetical protein
MAEEISPLEDHGWWMERLRKDAKANRPEALRLAAQLEDAESAKLHLLPYAAAELRHLHAVNQELLAALISFTNSAYIKKHHPKRYAAAIAAIKKAEGNA